MTENQLEQQIIDGLRCMPGTFAFATHDAFHRPAASGVPDIIACRNGQMIAIECKVGKAQPTPEQQTFLAVLANAGAVAIVARSWDDVERHL